MREIAGCAIIEDKKLLLLWKIKRNHYELPGGKPEEHEQLDHAAVREAMEEIGCDVILEQYAGSFDFDKDGQTVKSHVWLAKIKPGQTPVIMENEIFSELIWMPLQDYEKQELAPNVRLFIQDYLK
jgi:8-oxo-dGTP pyrophosphatase MutT (NUDIX family)